VWALTVCLQLNSIEATYNQEQSDPCSIYTLKENITKFVCML
jgi:hypothetical protein